MQCATNVRNILQNIMYKYNKMRVNWSTEAVGVYIYNGGIQKKFTFHIKWHLFDPKKIKLERQLPIFCFLIISQLNY